MLIFFGLRSKVIPGYEHNDILCARCDTSAQVSYGISKYFHIFWIPVIAYKKVVGIKCRQCGTTREGKYMPGQLRSRLRKDVLSFKRTWTSYFGLLAMGAIFAVSFVIATINSLIAMIGGLF